MTSGAVPGRVSCPAGSTVTASVCSTAVFPPGVSECCPLPLVPADRQTGDQRNGRSVLLAAVLVVDAVVMDLTEDEALLLPALVGLAGRPLAGGEDWWTDVVVDIVVGHLRCGYFD